MKKTLLLLPAVLLLLPGCLVIRETRYVPRTKKSEMKSRPDCRPNQYWDGEKCRHKGKGKGARKHDD